MTVWNNYNGIDYSENGLLNDPNLDSRSPLVKTPRGAWRPPTSYTRSVDSGNIYTYELTLRDYWFVNVIPPKYNGKITYAGAAGASGYYYTAIPNFPGNLEDQAIIKARLKLKGTKISLPQNIGERRQTARLISSNLSRLTDMVRSVRRLRPKDAFSLWLEMQYGWKPLISDSYGAMEALHAREKETSGGVTTVKAYVRENEKLVYNLSDSANNAVFDFQKLCDVKHTGHIRLDFTPSDGPWSGTLAQLGLTNPLELAWELLPWSFVADWFIPIGDYLSQLDATNGWVFKGGSFSSKSTMVSRPVNFQMRPDQYKWAREAYAYGRGKGYQMRFHRKAYSSPPLANLPSFGKLNKASNIHVANGIALLMSAIVGGSKVR
jgi:hypothetical protein